jgi:hypothetical protein
MNIRLCIGKTRERRAKVLSFRLAALALAMTALSGCSIAMEANRPTPVDLSQFQPGDTRDSVVEKLGDPVSAKTDASGASCDHYNLYTHGYGAAGKAGVALLEGAADVFTLGAAEVLLSPAEIVTKNETHPVTFCYRDGKLAQINENGQEIASSGSPAPSQTAQTAASETAGTKSTPPMASTAKPSTAPSDLTSTETTE